MLVVIFPDNIFKYASSVMRHFPELFPDAEDSAAAPADPLARLYDEMVRHAKVSPDAVDTAEAMSLMQSKNAFVVDVRAPGRYGAAHVAGAVNIPLMELGAAAGSLPADRDRPIVCVCDVGNISANGMLYIKSLGYTNVKSLSGGTRAWMMQGLPIEP